MSVNLGCTDAEKMSEIFGLKVDIFCQEIGQLGLETSSNITKMVSEADLDTF